MLLCLCVSVCLLAWSWYECVAVVYMQECILNVFVTKSVFAFIIRRVDETVVVT